MKSISEVKDLSGKKVLVRTDFDITLENGNISEPFRIKKQVPTLGYLLSRGAKIVMVAHISATDSFKELLPQLKEIIGSEIEFIANLDGLKEVVKDSEPGLFLLDNVRQNDGEEKNDYLFAETMSNGFDLYVNNAFAVCHRKHASVSAIAKFLPAYSGFLIEEETAQLNKALDLPGEGKIFIMGGAKASTKIPVIKNFINRAEGILIGGVIANNILKARGADIGLSVSDENVSELLEGLDIGDKRLVMPVDYNVFENKIFDIGSKTIAEYVNMIENAKMIVWNGPMGLFEDERFSAGTDAVTKAAAKSAGIKIIGGGDTIAAVNKFGMLDKFDFVSTGGGSMLAFLAGDKLPGLEALGYYE
jgi:phosphoglycerate kinase